jgi:Na+-translocating ferredoxin:NAD+ oxidoreductase RnfD subunit
MSAKASSLTPAAVRPIARFVRTPKGTLCLMFAALGVLAVATSSDSRLLHNLLLAISLAGALDFAIVAVRRDRWLLPDGAMLTGAIVAFLLRPQEPDYVIALAVIVAILSKHLLRTRWSNVLNPAAVGLVFSGVVLQSGQSWWGALPDAGLLGLVALGVMGYYLVDRLNKLPMVLVFLGAYFGLFTVAGLLGHAGAVAEVYRSPDLQAVLFFSVFMLDDPPTSPVRYEDQVVYGLGVATLAYVLFMLNGAVYYLPAALLAGNVWESCRRVWFARRRRRVESRTRGAQDDVARPSRSGWARPEPPPHPDQAVSR